MGNVFGGRELSLGLGNLASMTGGAFYSGVGRATGAFASVEAQITNFYELGLESAPGDDDGQPHKLDLKIKRPGVSVRSRREVVASLRAANREDDTLIELMSQPTDAADLPFAIATYSIRGTDSDTVTLLVSADMGLGAAVQRPIEWGFAIADGEKMIASRRQRMDSGEGPPPIDTMSAAVDPGKYVLHVAALDGAGRGGVIQLPIAVGLRAVGPLTMSDVIVGSAADERLRPQARVNRAAGIVATAELYATDARQLDGVRLALHLMRDGDGRPTASVRGVPLQCASPARCAVEVRLDTAPIPPGAYVASLVVSIDGTDVGKVSRGVVIIP
jgi:hypothetical protein